ncbi:hypothetical protein ACH4OT_18680 [Streptomyces murinus]
MISQLASHKSQNSHVDRQLLVNVGTPKVARYALPETAAKMNAA